MFLECKAQIKSWNGQTDKVRYRADVQFSTSIVYLYQLGVFLQNRKDKHLKIKAHNLFMPYQDIFFLNI